MNNMALRQQQEASHILYSTGYLFDGFDYFQSLEKLSNITQRSPIQVQERILCCKKRRLKSSRDLDQLNKLKNKLINLGLDVYIKTA